MSLHHSRHHKTYITNLNALLVTQAEALQSKDIVKQLELQPLIKFQGGGHVNHSLFWESLAPTGSTETVPVTSAPALLKVIAERWGSLEQFKDAWTKVALALQGSGWVWLVKDVHGRSVDIVTSKDQDLPRGELGTGAAGGGLRVPVLGLDMWEHAYYLQYWNDKKEYVGKWWNVVNWKKAEERWKAEKIDEIYGSLSGLMSRL